MAQVTVFVDDAVRGALPSVCVKDGVATSDELVVRHELGDRAGLGVAWLLFLVGPLGWIALAVLSASRSARGEVLTVQLPMSEPAYQRLTAVRRLRQRAVLAGVLGGLVALVALTSSDGSPGDGALWRAVGLMAGAAVIGAIVALFVAGDRERKTTVGIDLDASRRWVTLSRVHPTFVAACQAQEQRQPQRT